MKDPELARQFAARRAQTEGQRMIVWHNPQDLGFGRFVVRPADGVAPRTFDARGQRVAWTIFQIVEPGERATTRVDT
jgi:hypothetical protein